MESKYKNPVPTVDIIIEIKNDDTDNSNVRKIVLIQRKNPPFGWALPGGFVDYGESLENAARREALEETSLKIELVRQFHTYSDPERDPRQHTISTVFIAKADGLPKGMDDAEKAELFDVKFLPEKMAFDHGRILGDYVNNKY